MVEADERSFHNRDMNSPICSHGHREYAVRVSSYDSPRKMFWETFVFELFYSRGIDTKNTVLWTFKCRFLTMCIFGKIVSWLKVKYKYR